MGVLDDDVFKNDVFYQNDQQGNSTAKKNSQADSGFASQNEENVDLEKMQEQNLGMVCLQCS